MHFRETIDLYAFLHKQIEQNDMYFIVIFAVSEPAMCVMNVLFSHSTLFN